MHFANNANRNPELSTLLWPYQASATPAISPPKCFFRLREMTGDTLPLEVEEFIGKYVSSIEQLDILEMFLADPETEWTVQDVYKRVLSSPQLVEQHLRFFKAKGFIEESKTVPATFHSLLVSEVKSAAEHTLRCYKEMPVRVIRFIYDRKPNGPQEFADAFILKRPD